MRVDLLSTCTGLGDLAGSGTVGGGSQGWSNVSTCVSRGACSRVSSRVSVDDCSSASIMSLSSSTFRGASLDLRRWTGFRRFLLLVGRSLIFECRPRYIFSGIFPIPGLALMTSKMSKLPAGTSSRLSAILPLCHLHRTTKPMIMF